MTRQECKKILSVLGFELGVSPKLITERLLSDNDKVDMMDGVIPIASLRANIEVWVGNGMPDYVSLNSNAKKTPSYM